MEGLPGGSPALAMCTTMFRKAYQGPDRSVEDSSPLCPSARKRLYPDLEEQEVAGCH